MVGTNEQTPAPPPIDSLPEFDLRREIIERIDTALGRFPESPEADGDAINGYKRKEQGLPSLGCSYFQFSKASEGEKQIAVQIALIQIFNSPFLASIQSKVETGLRDTNPSEGTKAKLDQTIKYLHQLKQSVAKDGIAPADNRYYFIPLNPIQPAIVSTESFITREYRINPQVAGSDLPPELITKANQAEDQPVDKVSGQPQSKIANLQDFRDALAIVRDGDWLVKTIISAEETRKP